MYRIAKSRLMKHSECCKGSQNQNQTIECKKQTNLGVEGSPQIPKIAAILLEHLSPIDNDLKRPFTKIQQAQVDFR